MSDQDNSHPAYNYCAMPLAVFACRPDQSQGRIFNEPESKNRTAFQRDHDRIIHASAFRRLKYKTQVFVYHEGDHYRTRLSHTLEVAQVARTLARSLMVNEDLAETIALAHDLGHTPFAHIGEVYLQKAMEAYGGFDHNDQSLRVLTTLERKYPAFNGLNLTYETLEGVVKHNGPVDGTINIALEELRQKIDLPLDNYASIEAQTAAIADDIAYNNHDVEDGLRAGLFTLEELEGLTILREAIAAVREQYPEGLDERYMVYEMIREMIGAMVSDVLAVSRANLKRINPQSVNDVRNAGEQIVAFSDDMRTKVDELRKFLYTRMYRHFTINRIWLKVERIVGDLFTAFHDQYQLMPDNWQRRITEAKATDDPTLRARIVCDYIAGMTDRYAIREHERLFDLYWDLR